MSKKALIKWLRENICLSDLTGDVASRCSRLSVCTNLTIDLCCVALVCALLMCTGAERATETIVTFGI